MGEVTPKVNENSETSNKEIGQFKNIKIKSCCVIKETIIKVTRKPQGGEKYLKQK